MASVAFKFSEHFGIRRTRGDDWFDPILTVDTKLFPDPFRIYASDRGAWAGAHGQLIDFFNLVLELVAQAGGNPASQHLHAARRLLLFPEPAEFCLGYGATPEGAGSGGQLGAVMLKAARTTVGLGIESVSHFEEMVLFQEQVGADRIGDITCNVLKARFIKYTQQVCRRHGVTTERLPVSHASWSRRFKRWADEIADLPRNPFTGRAVLLSPQRFLRQLPTVDPDEFWDWVFANENEHIRGEFNYDVASNIKGKRIAELARRNPDLTKKYVRRFEDEPKPAYDVKRDPKGTVSWYDSALALSDSVSTIADPGDPADFCDFVYKLLEEFRKTVEARDGWPLLWVGDRPRDEKHVQRLFRTAMIGYCQAHDIDFSSESNAGRGPVDFKFSQGWNRRALVEVKLANNSKYWHGLETQTPIYMASEDIQCGYFVTVRFTENDFKPERTRRVQEAATRLSKEQNYALRPIFVDARPKRSASKA